MTWMILCQLITLYSVRDQITFEEWLWFMFHRNVTSVCHCAPHLHQMLLGKMKMCLSYPLFQIHHIHWVWKILLYSYNNSLNLDLCMVIFSDKWCWICLWCDILGLGIVCCLYSFCCLIYWTDHNSLQAGCDSILTWREGEVPTCTV